jgi:hypothetical protein
MDDHWLSWQAEQAGTNSAPSIAAVLALLAVVTLLLLALFQWPEATASGGELFPGNNVPSSPASTVPACARHWPPTCRDASGGR